MCGRFVLMTPSKSLVERFGLEEEPVLEPRYNIAPTQMAAVISKIETRFRGVYYLSNEAQGMSVRRDLLATSS